MKDNSQTIRMVPRFPIGEWNLFERIKKGIVIIWFKIVRTFINIVQDYQQA